MTVELIPNAIWSWHSTVAPAKVEGLLTVMEDVDEVLAVLLAKWAMGGVLLSPCMEVGVVWEDVAGDSIKGKFEEMGIQSFGWN